MEKQKLVNMKTKQVLVYSKGEQHFIKLLKHCDLSEKIMLYSIKEIVKQYFIQFSDYNIEQFKVYFNTQYKLLLSIDCVLDENSCCTLNDKHHVFMFYYISDQIKKYIQVEIKM